MGIRFIYTDLINYLEWEELSSLGIKHCFTIKPQDFGIKTEKDGALLRRRYEAARQKAGCLSEKIFFPQQVHGNRVHILREEESGIPFVAGSYIENCDALITNRFGFTLISQYADCTPISLVDRKHRVIACVHAGWRGTRGRILLESLCSMNKEYGSDPFDIELFLWPSIHQPSFEVNRDVAELFTESFPEHPFDAFLFQKGNKYHIDLVFLNVEMAKSFGIPGKNIHLSGLCSFSDPRFHSYRRDKEVSGRMAMILEL